MAAKLCNHCVIINEETRRTPGLFSNIQSALRSHKAFLVRPSSVLRFESGHELIGYTGVSQLEQIARQKPSSPFSKSASRLLALQPLCFA